MLHSKHPYAALLFTTLIAWPAHAQTPDSVQAEKATVVDTVEVRVVNVDVTVVDKKGDPVTGLGPDDFVLLEDGIEVPLSNFYATGSGAASRAESTGGTPTEGKPATDGTRLAATPEPLTLAIYLDERNTIATHLSRVRADIQSFLEDSYLSEAEILVATYRNRLEILSPPSRDPAAAIEALHLDSGFAQGIDPQLSRTRVLSQIRDSYNFCNQAPFCRVCFDNWEEMLALARGYSANEQTRSAVGVSGVADIVAGLSGRDGKKALLYVGDGVQMFGGYSVFSYVGEICEGVRPQAINEVFRHQTEFDSNRRFGELAAYANANRVSFFMLDAGGIRQLSTIEFGNADLRPSTWVHQQYIENLQSTHALLAHETGGKALLNTNRPLKALIDLASEIGAGTYSLGFAPTHGRSGRIHLLEVKLKGNLGKGKRLRYRRSYLDKTVDAELVDELAANLFLELPRNPLAARLSVLEARSVSRRRAEVDVEVLAPKEAFFLEEGPDGTAEGSARLWLTALNNKGQRADVRQEVIELGPAGVEAEGGVYAFVVTLELTKGIQTIAMGLRDERTTRRSILRVEADLRRKTLEP